MEGCEGGREGIDRRIEGLVLPEAFWEALEEGSVAVDIIAHVGDLQLGNKDGSYRTGPVSRDQSERVHLDAGLFGYKRRGTLLLQDLDLELVSLLAAAYAGNAQACTSRAGWLGLVALWRR